MLVENMAEKEKRESWKKSKIGIEKMCLHQAITQLAWRLR